MTATLTADQARGKYRKGRAREYDFKDHLIANGYTWVCRAAGSHGVADLIMVKPGELLFVQCKPKAADSPAKRAELRRVAAMAGAVPLVAGWVNSGPRGGRLDGLAVAPLLRGHIPRAWPPRLDPRPCTRGGVVRIECDNCGCAEFIIRAELGRWYIECDMCSASVADMPDPSMSRETL